MSVRPYLGTGGIIVLLLAVIPSYFVQEWSHFMAVFSNTAFLLPIFISYYNNSSQIILLLSLVLFISSLYHTCRCYGVCAYLNSAGWMYMDVTYSWFTLLCLCSLLVLEKYFWELAPLNAAIVIFTHEAHCKSSDFECRSVKMVVVGVYLLAAFILSLRYKRKHDILDVILTGISFIIAVSIYLFSNNEANHAVWHIFCALGFSFALTMRKGSTFHTLGLRNGSDKNTRGLDGSLAIIFPHRRYEEVSTEARQDLL